MTRNPATTVLGPLCIGIAAMALLAGCSHQAEPAKVDSGKNYNRPLPAGTMPLRKVQHPDRMPDLAIAWSQRDVFLGDAMDRSIAWYDAPSSRQWFPCCNITHEQAKASVVAMRELMRTTPDPDAFECVQKVEAKKF